MSIETPDTSESLEKKIARTPLPGRREMLVWLSAPVRESQDRVVMGQNKKIKFAYYYIILCSVALFGFILFFTNQTLGKNEILIVSVGYLCCAAVLWAVAMLGLRKNRMMYLIDSRAGTAGLGYRSSHGEFDWSTAKETIDLAQVRGLQVLFVSQQNNLRYYQLNLVLGDASRSFLHSCRTRDEASRAAELVASFLEIPIMEAAE